MKWQSSEMCREDRQLGEGSETRCLFLKEVTGRTTKRVHLSTKDSDL